MIKFTKESSVNINELDIHPEANATPRMTNEQYIALKIDIERNGLIEPIVLYRGRIIDGRHRFWILKELGIENVSVVSIPNNSTLADIRTLVKSKETHRHQTPTQLSIFAYRQMISNNLEAKSKDKIMTQSDAAKEYGVAVRQISRVVKIDTVLLRPDILDLLFAGDKFNIGTSNRPLLTDSLQSVINHLDKIKAESMLFDFEIKLDNELTEEDNFIVTKILNVAREQSRKVREALSKRLYAELNDLPDEE